MTHLHEHANEKECKIEHQHEHHHHHHDHASLGRQASRKALIGALIILFVLLIVEVIGGLLTNSLALLSDAAHLLTDVAAVGLALFAQWFARRPSSAQRSYGYRRVEIMAALFNGLSLWIVAVFICIEAFERLWDPPEVEGTLMLIIASIGLVAQTGAALILAKASGESLNVRGAYVHAMTDAVQSVGVVIVALVIMYTGFVLVDPILSIVIGLMIIWSGGKIVAEAVHVLLEGTPREIDLQKLAQFICHTPDVQKVTDLHVWSLTTGYNALSAHIVGDPDLDANGRELLTELLTAKLKEVFPIHHVTLQVEKRCHIDHQEDCGDWMTFPK